MRQLRQPVPIANSLLRVAIRRVFARPLLTGSLLLGLAPMGHALTLGEISVRSTLGQPLDARVPVRLGDGEALASTCVVPGRATADLRSVPGALVTTPQASREGDYELRVSSPAPLYEPMYELELKVQCPGAPVLVRQYVLMLDLPGAVASSSATDPGPAILPAPVAAQSSPVQPERAVSQPQPARRLSLASRRGETIAAGVRYRVAAGDSLSSIAARVHTRTVSLWTLAAAIQAANPDAFIRGDANLIKLGSEILIPAAVTTDAPAPAPRAEAEPRPAASAPSAVAQVPTPELATPPPAVATPSEVAQATLPVAAQAVAPRPAAAPVPVARRTPAQRSAAPAVEVPGTNQPNPIVAAGAGILFGLCVSVLLWFRGRLPSRQRAAPRVAPTRELANAALATAVQPVKAAAPLVTRPMEPAFSVSYTPPAEDTLESEFSGEDLTSELEDLFDSTDTTIQKRLTEKTLAARSLGARDADEDDQGLIAPGSAVDFLVGEPTDEEETLRATTVDQPLRDMDATVDIHALAASATGDQKQAQTLLEALTLLERDYEEELTASQILDMSAVRAALDNDPDATTQVGDTAIRVAWARKKSR